MGFINIGEFAVKKLGDARQSYVAVLNYKLEIKNHLLGDFLDALNIDPSAKSKLREVFDTFNTVRTHVTTYDDDIGFSGSVSVDLTYQAQWKNSALLTAGLIEDMVFNTTFDPRYRDGIKTHAELSDIMEYP